MFGHGFDDSARLALSEGDSKASILRALGFNHAMRLGEINIICTDLVTSRAFYCDFFGFEALEMEGPDALHCRLGATRFLLLAVASEKADNQPYCRHATISFDLACDDLAALVKRLENANHRFAQAFDGHCAFVYDPDGNVIELLQA